MGKGLLRSLLRIVLGVLAVLGTGCLLFWYSMIRMPGTGHQGPLPPLSQSEQSTAMQLQGFVEMLAGKIGQRHVAAGSAYNRARDAIESQFVAAGFQVQRQWFLADGVPVSNLIVEVRGRDRPQEIVVLGAHYDSAWGTPGADDNASGVAGLLWLAGQYNNRTHSRTLRLVAFANEEPPYFQTEHMGSLQYARACRARGENIVAMLALEMLGFFRDDPGSQAYPPPFSFFYPDRGDFITFVGNLDSRALVHQCIASFRRHSAFPSEGVATFGGLPGIGFSDHWSFWQIGVPALMVTDTADFRSPHYHQMSDTPDTLDYQRMARVVHGLEGVVLELLTAGND